MPTCVEQLDGALARGLAGQPAMQQQDLADLLLDRVQRIERGHRLLEDDGDVVAAHADASRVSGRRSRSLALEADRAGRMPRGRIGQELHHRERGHRFAGAGLADQRQRLALA